MSVLFNVLFILTILYYVGYKIIYRQHIRAVESSKKGPKFSYDYRDGYQYDPHVSEVDCFWFWLFSPIYVPGYVIVKLCFRLCAHMFTLPDDKDKKPDSEA